MSKRRQPFRGPSGQSRRFGTREPLARFVVITEGQRTEPRYLAELQDHVNAVVTIRTEAPNSDPVRLAALAVERLKAARKVQALEKNDEFWCFLDVDDYGDQIARAREVARNGRVHVAVSNPCFEVWLLAHFRFTSAPLTRPQLAKALADHLPGYSAKSKGFDLGVLPPLYSQASANAQRLEAHHEAAGNERGADPSSEVHLFMTSVARHLPLN
jgi:hypothetical protein